MNQKTYFRIAGVFFLADAILHAIRLIAWWKLGFVPDFFPLWVSPIAVLFSGCMGLIGLGLGMRSSNNNS
jgi:hypothetical protein